VGFSKELMGWRGTYLCCSSTLDGREENTTLAIGRRWVDEKVRASHRSHDDFSVHHQRETDSVLVAAEEAFGAIDRVESPDT
jgi:hypothetical protein